MKSHVIYLTTAIFALLAVFTACEKEKDKGIPVTGVTLNMASVTLAPTDTVTLIATVQPDNATCKTVTWSSSDSSVAMVNNGLVMAIAEGSAIITATTDDGKKTASCIIIVEVVPVTGVVLNGTSVTLAQTDSITLIATVHPDNATNKAVTWSSSNLSVAIVDNKGTVTGITEGTADITVTTDDGNKTASCNITVKNISVTGVVLNRTSVTLFSTDTITLIATVQPNNATNKAVTWESSNSAVATVSNAGLVTAKNGGTADITVTTDDGNKTASCNITVKYHVTGVTLNKTTLTLGVGETETLTATVQPDNANKAVIWSSNNPTAATVDNGTVIAKAKGSATITVTTVDGGKTATCALTVYAQGEGVVINGVCWATRNVDMPGTFAKNPEDAGMFYQWNRRIGWSSTDPMVNSNGGTTWDDSTPTGNTWEPVNNPCPAGYRVPTEEELKSLTNTTYVTHVWTNINGINGYRCTDKVTGNSIFLPAAGIRGNSNGSLSYAGSYGYYWSSTPYSTTGAYYLYFYDGYFYVYHFSNRAHGRSLRCVAEN